MAWPFSRRGRPAEPTKPARVLSQADRAVLTELETWLAQERPELRTRFTPEAGFHVFLPAGGEQVPLMVVRSRTGKLVRLEVRDEQVRPLADRIVKAFEKKGLWSFNGVVRQMDPEPGSQRP